MIPRGIILVNVASVGFPPGATVGERLKSARTSLKWKSNKLCKAAGLPNGYVSKVERGKMPRPGAHHMNAIARVLGLNPDWLISGNGEPFAVEPSEAMSSKDKYPNRARAVSTALEWSLNPQAIQAVQAIEPPDGRDRPPYWWFKRIERAAEDLDDIPEGRTQLLQPRQVK